MITMKHVARLVAGASAVSLALVALGSGAAPANAIVGGQPATDAAPYDGSFQRLDSPRNSEHVCGATLIAPRWAITAGHCTGQVDTSTSLSHRGDVKIALSGDPVGWKVRFGSRHMTSGGRSVDVQQFVRASRTIAPEGDIALLKLSRPVRATPAAVATRPPRAGAPASIRGWGYTGKGGLRDYERARSYPTVLRAATTTVSSHETCGLKPGERALCIGVDSRTGPDNMDSGGPVFVEERGRGQVLAGTVNGGNLVGGLRPSIYTDLSAHRKWIRAYTSGRRTIPRAKRPSSPGIAGTGTILSAGCSVAVVRVAASRPTDHAMVLTNGHCVTPRPRPGRADVDRAERHRVALNDATSNAVARATTTRLLYATMTGTDVALYRLERSYAELAARGVPARELATTGPALGDRLVMHAGALQTTYACTVGALVPTVREAGWTQRNVVRYATDDSCLPEGGSSGSPLIDPRTGRIVAVHNTHSYGDGKPCSEGNPCEVAGDGTVTSVKGRGYAQDVAGLAACISSGSRLNTSTRACALPAPGGR
jgi:secreted trypsin-like serine protease